MSLLTREDHRMKKSFAIIAALAAGFLSVSCQKEDENQVIEGQYTEFEISITTPAPTDVVMTKATDEQETRVENLALLFYKYENSTPLVVRVSNLSRIEGQGTSTNYFYKVKISSEDTGTDTPLMSGEWYLYAIANYNRVGFGNINFDEFATLPLSKAKDWYVHRVKPGASDLNMNEAAMLMSGFFGTDGKINLKPKSSAADKTVQTFTDHIHLRRIASKVSFNFATAEGVSFKPATYSIYNYPLLCHALENQGWNKKDGSLDNAMGTFPGTDIPALVNNASQVKDILDMPFDGSTTFYMYENVQRPVQTGCDVYTKRELRDAGDYGHFTYAPQYGTYVVVKGYYDGPISPSNPQKVTGDVTYTIHLGDFSSATGANDNFTIRRNAKYNYNVTINGVNSIYVEATTNTGEEPQPGAEGNLLAQPVTTDLEVDAHYVTTMVMIRKDFIHNSVGTIYPLSVITKTPKDESRIVEIPADGSVSSTGQDIGWVHFIKPQNSTSFVNYPGTGSSSMTDIYGLVKDLRSKGKKYYYESSSAGKTDYYYVQAFIDEYVYNDLPVSRYVNAASREIVLQHEALVSSDGHSSYIDQGAMSIRQKSIKSMYDLTCSAPDYYPFGIESIEENGTTGALILNHVNDISYNTKGVSMSNGYANSRDMVKTLSESWSTLYNASQAKVRKLTEDSEKTNTIARYACLQRNRDENGDGIIDDNELKWYLPSRDQAMAIIYGQKALGDAYPNTHLDEDKDGTLQEHEGVWYWTSSVSPAGTMYNPIERTLSFPQHGVISSGDVKIGGSAAIRCARTLNVYDAEPAKVLNWDEEKREMTVTNLNSVCIRGTINGEYLPHTQKDPINNLPASFVVAKNLLFIEGGFKTATERRFTSEEMKTGNWCQDYYSEVVDKSDLGTWRIPNQSEIFAMMRYMNFTEFVSYDKDGKLEGHIGTGCRTQMFLSRPGVGGHNYQTVFHISYNSSYGELNQSSNYSLKKGSVPSTDVPWYRIRCVRDSAASSIGHVSSAGNAASSTAADGGESRF